MSRKRQRILNDITRLSIRRQVMPYVTGAFTWENLPDGLTSEYLERFITGTLEGKHTCSMAIGFNHPVAGPVILPAYPQAQRNMYFAPDEFVAVGFGFTHDVRYSDGVLFYDNSAHHSLDELVTETVEELTNIWWSMHLNTKQQQNPWVFAGSRDEIASLDEAINSADEHNGVLRVTAGLMSSIESAKRFYPITPDFRGAELMEQYTQVLNRFLTVLGYDNVSIMKKERLITDEAHANDNAVYYNRRDRLKMREQAASEFNNKFGTNIFVRWTGSEVKSNERWPSPV